jgi:hypothetical protein
MSGELANPDCPKCRQPMRLVNIGANGPKFRCFDCSDDDPLRWSCSWNPLKGELRPPT